ncbi:MAG: hypothetical protein J0I02_12540, partial [Alphaproteobacteria bacterium]|nr:hypothetical protein [Alphaproteobacteria bacterium]
PMVEADLRLPQSVPVRAIARAGDRTLQCAIPATPKPLIFNPRRDGHIKADTQFPILICAHCQISHFAGGAKTALLPAPRIINQIVPIFKKPN